MTAAARIAPRYTPRTPALLLASLLPLLPSCGSADPAGNNAPPADGAANAAELVLELRDADPGRWPDLIPAVRALGPAAADPLTEAARDQQAPGHQAILKLLGMCGSPAARPTLLSAMAPGATQPQEAALALGGLGDPAATPDLQQVVEDQRRDPAVRTAAACALLDLHPPGGGNPRITRLAVDFLAAILTAGTPAGADAGAALGLPDRPRWARERHMAILAIGRASGGPIWSLDTDLPWPQLVERTATMRRELLGGG